MIHVLPVNPSPPKTKDKQTMPLLLTPLFGSAIIIGGSSVGLLLVIVIVVLLLR